MKQNILEFVRRGLIACGFGPLILAIVYLILQQQCAVHILSVNEVCTGILSLSVLAFIAGGMNVIYQIEQVPLMMAIFIHGGVLYIGYLITYLVNGWLEWGATPILVFTGIFIVCYLIIWAMIYCCSKRNTDRVNEVLQYKQQNRIE